MTTSNEEGVFGLKPETLLLLQRPTPASEIKQRQGSKQHDGPCAKPCRQQHMMLDYVDARYVMRTLDEIATPQNWQRTHDIGPDSKVTCSIGIRVLGEWVWKADGAGDTDIEGEKGSFSDAFKRAAVNWGIGRDLYGKDHSHARQRPRASRPDDDLMAGADDDDETGDDGGSCPYHGKPWREGKFGGYCASQASNGSPENAKGYCNAKPTKAWQAAHE